MGNAWSMHRPDVTSGPDPAPRASAAPFGCVEGGKGHLGGGTQQHGEKGVWPSHDSV